MNLLSKYIINQKLKSLNNQENKLVNSVIEIYDADKTKSNLDLPRHEIFNEYSLIHQIYSKLSSKSIEALKRGLFIQWYCYSEPQYLTGIGNLKRENENQILINLKKRLDANKADNELLWMLNYYLNWSELFDIYIDVFDYKLYLNKDVSLPSVFEINNRGQMGKYWNSRTNK